MSNDFFFYILGLEKKTKLVLVSRIQRRGHLGTRSQGWPGGGPELNHISCMNSAISINHYKTYFVTIEIRASRAGRSGRQVK